MQQPAVFTGKTRAVRRYRNSFFCRLFYHYEAHVKVVVERLREYLAQAGNTADGWESAVERVAEYWPVSERPVLPPAAKNGESELFGGFLKKVRPACRTNGRIGGARAPAPAAGSAR